MWSSVQLPELVEKSALESTANCFHWLFMSILWGMCCSAAAESYDSEYEAGREEDYLHGLIYFFFFCKWNSISLLYFCQFADGLKTKVSPAFKQAIMEPHSLNSMDFCPTNCHINLMEVSYPKNTTSAGRSFSIRIGRKPSIIGLDPEQGIQLSSHIDFYLHRKLHLYTAQWSQN